MKILVFCPTYRKPDGTLAIWSATQASLDNLDHGAHRVTVKVSVDEAEDKTGNVVKQYQKAQALTFSGKYDAVLFIEHDMIVPPDAILKMVECGEPVVYGVYMFRHGVPALNAFRQTSAASLDQSLQFFPGELDRAVKAQVYPVSGIGFGCTLIYREVFKTVNIRLTDGASYPDGPFCNDCAKAGIRQVAHFGVSCGHIRPDGTVLWPITDPRFVDYSAVKVRPVISFYGNVEGQSVRFEAGEVKSIPYEAAKDFQRAGFVAIESDGAA